MTTTETREHVRQVGWIADIDDTQHRIRDVDDRGRWDRTGSLYAEKEPPTGATHSLWVYVPKVWIDHTTLVPWYSGPSDLACDGATIVIARWYPGTSSSAHAYNPRARYFARLCQGLSFDEIKRRGPALLDAIACRLIAERGGR